MSGPCRQSKLFFHKHHSQKKPIGSTSKSIAFGVSDVKCPPKGALVTMAIAAHVADYLVTSGVSYEVLEHLNPVRGHQVKPNVSEEWQV